MKNLQLDFLESELKMVQENIQRIKKYEKEQEYNNYQSRVVGEFKHRLIALKQRITLVGNIVTSDLH